MDKQKHDNVIISQPKWKRPTYSKKQINKAGDAVRRESCSDSERAFALKVIDEWRASHAYPMHVFYINLRQRAKNNSSVIVAERLKRLTSIVGKLQREKTMQLYRMQDLGGCRVILPTVEEVIRFKNDLYNSRIRHVFSGEKNYIESPKTSGYRSIHNIYKFRTDTKKNEIYNNYDFLIEIQFRTHLQHLWATAVEVMGLLERENLKASQGNKDTMRFFALVSSLFAEQEGTPRVPNTPVDSNDCKTELRELNDKLHLIDKLEAVNLSIRDSNNQSIANGYVVLELNYDNHELRYTFYKPNEIEIANEYYDSKEDNSNNLDVVLIRTNSFKDLKKAYPNYFLDISEFISRVKAFI